MDPAAQILLELIAAVLEVDTPPIGEIHDGELPNRVDHTTEVVTQDILIPGTPEERDESALYYRHLRYMHMLCKESFHLFYELLLKGFQVERLEGARNWLVRFAA